MAVDRPFFERVYDVVGRVPRGRVASYGQIARMLGNPRAARQVGWAMRCCPDALPWQRIVRDDGAVTGGEMAAMRRALLAAEGVPFLPDGRVDMPRCRWDGAAERKRCAWCVSSEAMTRYHDEEWGVPLTDDRGQFEFIALEVLQCGLSWNLMIKKRAVFRRCFSDFDFDAVAAYGEADVARILATDGMIRSRRKAEAIVHNARCFQRVRVEHGTFSAYLWALCGGRVIRYQREPAAALPARNALSDRVAADLRRRGFKYLGSVTVYAHLQSCGIINDHEAECFGWQEVQARYPVACLPPEDER